MKKRKTTSPYVSDGKKLVLALGRLFRAKDSAAAHQALGVCLVHVKTLGHIRALYSWVVTPHRLSVYPLNESEYVRARVRDRWVEMVGTEFARIVSDPKVASKYEVWRSLHELSPSSEKITRAIGRIWNEISLGKTRSFSDVQIIDLCHFGADPKEDYLGVHEEVLQHAGLLCVTA